MVDNVAIPISGLTFDIAFLVLGAEKENAETIVLGQSAPRSLVHGEELFCRFDHNVELVAAIGVDRPFADKVCRNTRGRNILSGRVEPHYVLHRHLGQNGEMRIIVVKTAKDLAQVLIWLVLIRTTYDTIARN